TPYYLGALPPRACLVNTLWDWRKPRDATPPTADHREEHLRLARSLLQLWPLFPRFRQEHGRGRALVSYARLQAALPQDPLSRDSSGARRRGDGRRTPIAGVCLYQRHKEAPCSEPVLPAGHGIYGGRDHRASAR